MRIRVSQMGQRAGNWADRVAELCGAAALAGGVGASAWLCAPHGGAASAALAGGAAALGGLVGWAIVRAAPGAAGAMPDFHLDPMTDVVVEKPQVSESLLDDPAEPPEASRVVQLFGPPVADTPGALQARIAAHLGDPAREIARSDGEPPKVWNGSPAIPDASDALHAALDEIRRSLRAR